MSKLLEETNEYLLLEAYVHNNSDDYSPWELEWTTEGSKEKYSEGVHLAEHYALMEVKVIYKIYKDSTPNEPHVEYESFDDLIIWDDRYEPDTREMLRGMDHPYTETEKTPGLCVCGYLKDHERHV